MISTLFSIVYTSLYSGYMAYNTINNYNQLNESGIIDDTLRQNTIFDLKLKHKLTYDLDYNTPFSKHAR